MPDIKKLFLAFIESWLTNEKVVPKLEDLNIGNTQNYDTIAYGHKLSMIYDSEDKKQKLCAFCKSIGVKTSSGGYILTRHKCDVCNIPLCTGKRKGKECFDLYHIALFYQLDPAEVFQLYQKLLTQIASA